jgi:hypothetical protein
MTLITHKYKNYYILIACTHPLNPPLYSVKRGKWLLFNVLSPLFASAERGLGGEYV